MKESNGFSKSDVKGKLFEILTGSYMMYDQESPINYLNHYRVEFGKSPEAIHGNLKDKLDFHCPGEYNILCDHAKQSANYAKDYFRNIGISKIDKVVWTSQPSDHLRLTGIDDQNSDADLMIYSDNQYYGLSLKYATKVDCNLRNNGLDSLEKMAELQEGSLVSIKDKHNEYVKELGFLSHEDYKSKKNDPKYKLQVSLSIESALKAQKDMAKLINENIKEFDSEKLRDYVLNVVSPPTVFKHYRMHTRPLKTTVAYNIVDVNEESMKLNSFDELRVRLNNTMSTTIGIEGRRKETDVFEPVLVQTIKKISGPTRGFASSTKAPFKSKRNYNV